MSKRLYEFDLDKNKWLRKMDWLISIFIFIPLIIGITQCESNEGKGEGVYAE